jgi:hypothetical protein
MTLLAQQAITPGSIAFKKLHNNRLLYCQFAFPHRALPPLPKFQRTDLLGAADRTSRKDSRTSSSPSTQSMDLLKYVLSRMVTRELSIKY